MTATFSRCAFPTRLTLLAAAAIAVTLPAHAADGELVGWAQMPANTFSEGPTSGQFATSNFPGSNPLPLVGLQPVQGFSGVLAGPVAGTYHVMTDNGFGNKANSADALLRTYAVTPDFKRWVGGAVVGAGSIGAANYQTGAALPSFTANSHINLRDPDRKLGFTIQADYTHYYNNAANPLVDSSIRSGRLLTGADLDVESMRKDKNGNVWYGDEFGPFLVKTDATGKVLRQEIALPGVQSPDNPHLGSGAPNLNRSAGFEGMAINKSGDRLFTLLEGTVAGDPEKSLRINQFNIDTESFEAASALYKLDPLGTNIGDMTAIDDHRFLVIERNGATATGGSPFKKVYQIDIDQLDADGYAKKTEVIDLMNLKDAHDLNGDGSTTFTFPYVTIEDIVIVDANTVMIINDNNYPGGGGRGNFADNTEFLLVSLTTAVPEPQTYALMLAGLGMIGFVGFRRARR